MARLEKEYDLEDCASINAMSFVTDDIELDKIIDWEKLTYLMENLGIHKKAE